MIRYVDDSTHDIKNMQKHYDTDAGYDICGDENFTLWGGESAGVITNLKVAIPVGYVGIDAPRSGLNFNKDVIAEIGIIDASYRGYIKVKLTNLTSNKMNFKAGAKIAQMVVVPIYRGRCIEVENLDDTERGDNGFGSSDNNLKEK